MDKVEEYVSSSQSYLNEADGMLKKQDYSKAGEMLWGAVAALIKAIGNNARQACKKRTL